MADSELLIKSQEQIVMDNLDKVHNENESLKEQIKHLLMTISAYQDENGEIEREKGELIKHIDFFREKSEESFLKMVQLSNTLSNLKQEIIRLSEENNEYKNSLNEMKTKTKTVKNENNELREQTAKYEDILSINYQKQCTELVNINKKYDILCMENTEIHEENAKLNEVISMNDHSNNEGKINVALLSRPASTSRPLSYNFESTDFNDLHFNLQSPAHSTNIVETLAYESDNEYYYCDQNTIKQKESKIQQLQHENKQLIQQLKYTLLEQNAKVLYLQNRIKQKHASLSFMSRASIFYIDIFLTLSISATGISNDFICINNICSCLTGECSHTCSSHGCNSQYFVCPSSATLCLVNCIGVESCKYAKIFGAADNVVVNCNGTDSCTGTHISCGQPQSLPNDLSSYSTNQFTGSVTDCLINLYTPNAMRFGDVSCDGSITNCVIDAYSPLSISESLFACATDGNRCELNCMKSTSCYSIQFECDSPQCSCGISDEYCENEEIQLIYNNALETEEHYNCMDLRQTELEIRSMAISERDSTFHFEISGKDADHGTIELRSKNIDRVSSASYDVHHSVYFVAHEAYGKTYEFEWAFNEPNIICWLTQQLSAIKIDLFYNKNISFAFTYIYSEEMVTKPSGGWILTAKNNWNLGEIGVTYLENGFIYFDYEYNITLSRSLTAAPTSKPTSNPTGQPSTTNTNDSLIANHSQYDILITTDSSSSESKEQKVRESTRYQSSDSKESIKARTITQNSDTPIKALLFAIALAAMCSICCIIGCIVYSRRKQTKRIEAVYASADGSDTEDDEEDRYTSQGNQADIEEEDEVDDVDGINDVDEDIRIGSGILDENDLMDGTAGDKRGHGSDSQSSLIKKYKTLDPRKILPAKLQAMRKRQREQSESKSVSESGIGYIAKSKKISNNDDDCGLSDDEEDDSLIARDGDISMDAEYHHVITQQNNEDDNADEDVMYRLNDDRREETLGFEPGSILEHYVNQDSTFETLRKSLNTPKEEDVSVEQSMSRLSQSLSIPPIELDTDITNVKMLKSKTTIQSAADSMKQFSRRFHDNEDNEDNYATMVIYKNTNTSSIPESQIVQSTTPPPIPLLDAVHVCLEPESTQTMIVHTHQSSLDTKLSQLHQSSRPQDIASDDSSESSEETRDPIDASDEDDIVSHRKRQKKKSYHDRATMIINDDLDIDNLI